MPVFLMHLDVIISSVIYISNIFKFLENEKSLEKFYQESYIVILSDIAMQ